MLRIEKLLFVLFVFIGLNCTSAMGAEQTKNDALPSWNESAAKKSIFDFVARVTREGSPKYVKPEERIATFDNDGTLWAEQPMYFQIIFAMDRVKALAPKHPDWKTKQPFKAVLDNDTKVLAALGEKGFLKIIAATRAGLTAEEFNKIVADRITIARVTHAFNRQFGRSLLIAIYWTKVQ